MTRDLRSERGFPRRGWTDNKKSAHQKKKPEDKLCLPASKPNEFESSLISNVFARFRSTHDQFAAKEFLIVQFRDGAFGLIHGQHLHKGKTL